LHLKDIELKTDIQKNDLISQLGLCGSFAGTHAIISKLSRFSSWTNEQIIQLLQAATNNNQVWAIIDDFDIKIFYNSILKDKSTKFLDQSEFEWILERLGYKKE
jgi:hypothetical protein